MITNKLLYIKKITNKKDQFYLKLYFIGFIFISLLETIGIGLVPGFFSILLDKYIILNKFNFSQDVYNLLYEFLNSENLLLIISIFIIIFFLLKSLFSLIFYFYEAKIFNDLKIKISSNLFKIYLRKDYLFHSTNNPIILGRNISSEVNTSVTYIKSYLIFLKEIIQVLMIAVLLMFANLKVTIFIFTILIIVSLIYLKFFSKSLKDKIKLSYFERGEKSKIINQILNAIIEVKLYKKENYFLKKFTSSIGREFHSTMFLDIINKLPKLVIEILIVFLVCSTVIFTYKMQIKIEAVISIIALYFFAALRIYPSINNILLQRLALISGEISINNVSKDFSENLKFLSDNKDVNKIQRIDFQKSIRLKNISFRYPERNKILNDINLEIQKNEVVGIIGSTGGGKSTIIKIIMGLLEPSDGNIIIDEKNLNSIRDSWQKNISYIPQNFYILDDSIIENIVFSEDKEKINFDRINRILKITSLDKFINELPEKLNTIVGPNAKKISGGQAQRIAIARALYQDTNIMIFDEATNSLDADTEREIIDNVYNLKSEKTIIIVSHNEKILDKCDKIFKLDLGKLINIK